MSDESTLLRQLASEIDALGAMRSNFGNGPTTEAGGVNVDVTWSWGSSCVGYKELRAAIRKLVDAQWTELAVKAIEAQEAKVQLLRAQVAAVSSAWGQLSL